MSLTIDSVSQRFTSAAQPEADIVVLHTTEGTGWPGYSGGGEAPHATILPSPNIGIKVREHIPTSQYAKALMNLPGGVETNRRGVLQYELIGTCDPAHKDQRGYFWWPGADDVVLAALADYLRPILATYLIPLVAPAFKAYPSSYGANNRVRMSAAAWNSYNGIVGHMHVPENLHGDPGAFPIARLLALLGPRTPPPSRGPYTLNDVTKVQAAIGAKTDGDWGAITDTKALAFRARAVMKTMYVYRIRYLQAAVHVAQTGVWDTNTEAHFQRIRAQFHH